MPCPAYEHLLEHASAARDAVGSARAELDGKDGNASIEEYRTLAKALAEAQLEARLADTEAAQHARRGPVCALEKQRPTDQTA